MKSQKCFVCGQKLTAQNIRPGLGVVIWYGVRVLPKNAPKGQLPGVDLVEAPVCKQCTTKTKKLNRLNGITCRMDKGIPKLEDGTTKEV